MTLFESNVSSRRPVSFLASLSLALFSTSVYAQPTPTSPGAQPPAAASPPPVTPSQITGSPAAGQTPGDQQVVLSSPSALGFVERLPDTAYPTYPIRGIYGGSLWRTFNGLQWPYYPKTGIGISGDAWVDTGYEHVNSGAPNEDSAAYLVQQARVVLRATPTWSNGEYFVQGQVELVGNNNSTQSVLNAVAVSTDDAWIRVGRWNSWDIQVGRFQVWEIYHVGMGLDLFTQERQGAVLENELASTPPQIYVVNDQPDLRGTGVGQVALHLYPAKTLRFEAEGNVGSYTGLNTLSIRPAAIYDVGWLKVKAGATYETQNDVTEGGKTSISSRGLGGAVQFVIDPYLEFGLNGSYALVDSYGSDGSYNQTKSDTTYSLGAFLNAQPLPQVIPDLLLGFGYDYTYLEDQHYNPVLGRDGEFRQQQAFVAIQYYLWRQLFIKAIGGYAKADEATSFPPPPEYTDEMFSGRLRLEYLF